MRSTAAGHTPGNGVDGMSALTRTILQLSSIVTHKVMR
jgi:hypothetical protein